MSRQEKVIYALGFFDGVHKGHQAILETARQLARETGMRPGVFTYENHPQSVVGGSGQKSPSPTALPSRGPMPWEMFSSSVSA